MTNENIQKCRKIFSLQNIMSFPMITIQLLLITYNIIVLLIYLPEFSQYSGIHLPIILFLYGMAAASLIMTFKTDPGRVTTDIIEQIKLNLKFEQPHQHTMELESDDQPEKHPHSETHIDTQREQSQMELTINELNKQILRLMHSQSNETHGDLENTQEHNNDHVESLPPLCQFKHCTDCDRLQPPRVYHCEICGTCVLRLEHHCFWVGNCVGLYNLKMFTLYLFYMQMASAYVGLSITEFFTISAFEVLEIMIVSLNFTVVTFMSLALWICLMIMFCITMKLIYSNQVSSEIQQSRLNFSYFKRGKFIDNLRDAFLFTHWWEIFVPTVPKNVEFSKYIIPKKLN